MKGTAAALFPNVELTAGEWRAAEAHGDGYWLYLVADCCSTGPRIQRLRNPARIVNEGGAVLAPVVYRLSLLASAAAS